MPSLFHWFRLNVNDQQTQIHPIVMLRTNTCIWCSWNISVFIERNSIINSRKSRPGISPYKAVTMRIVFKTNSEQSVGIETPVYTVIQFIQNNHTKYKSSACKSSAVDNEVVSAAQPMLSLCTLCMVFCDKVWSKFRGKNYWY